MESVEEKRKKKVGKKRENIMHKCSISNETLLVINPKVNGKIKPVITISFK